SFDFVRVGLQLAHFLLELQIFLVQLTQAGVYLFNFLLRAAHGQIAMGAKNVVDKEDQHQQADERRPVVPQERRSFFFRANLIRFFQLCSTHCDASLTSFAEAAALSASTYRRSSGSVPERRRSIHEPSSKTNFAPSVRSMDTTFRPASVEASTATRFTAFAFCSSERWRFSRTGQNSRPSFLYIARICSPMEAPRAGIISATSRQARMPSFSGMWPRMVSPALSSPPRAILSSRMSWPMYLKPTGVWKMVCPGDFAAASRSSDVATLRAAGSFHPRDSTR